MGGIIIFLKVFFLWGAIQYAIFSIVWVSTCAISVGWDTICNQPIECDFLCYFPVGWDSTCRQPLGAIPHAIKLMGETTRFFFPMGWSSNAGFQLCGNLHANYLSGWIQQSIVCDPSRFFFSSAGNCLTKHGVNRDAIVLLGG